MITTAAAPLRGHPESDLLGLDPPGRGGAGLAAATRGAKGAEPHPAEGACEKTREPEEDDLRRL